MKITQIKAIIEAAILSARQPINLLQLAALWPKAERPSHRLLENLLTQLAQTYQDRGIILQKVATGYRFQIDAKIMPYLNPGIGVKPSRYSQALLETLAIIAYKQPITRTEIETIRGVSISKHMILTLEKRGWIKTVGHRKTPGKPILYATTHQFLNDLNLQNLSQLPTLSKPV